MVRPVLREWLVADLFGEVDEDLRAEQARVAVRRFGPALLGLLLVAAAGIGIWQYLVWRQHQLDARLSAAYFAAMRQADQPPLADQKAATAKAIDLFRPLTDAEIPGIRSLARLRISSLQATGGDARGAVASLDALAGDDQAPRPLRDLATLASVQHQLDGKTPDLATLALRLQGIEGAGDPFRDLALETSAAIELAQGKSDAARRTLQTVLADENATDSVRERVNTLLQAIGPTPAAGG